MKYYKTLLNQNFESDCVRTYSEIETFQLNNHLGFSSLSLVDQMALLQSGWMETLLLCVVWRSLASPQELQFAENLHLNEPQCKNTGLLELYTPLRLLIDKYQQLNISHEEAVTLRAMALANSGIQTHNKLLLV